MITQPLRDEHRELLPRVEKLKEVADAVGSSHVATIKRSIQEVAEFLSHHLIPHALAEDRALYPAVEKAIAAKNATATMSRDHQEVGMLSAELASWGDRLPAREIPEEQARELRRILYGLYALVKLHFAKEEEIYLPLLDRRLSSEEGRDLFEAMEKEAARAHAEVHNNE
jgi:hemerythrin-like domain-containing protein